MRYFRSPKPRGVHPLTAAREVPVSGRASWLERGGLVNFPSRVCQRARSRCRVLHANDVDAHKPAASVLADERGRERRFLEPKRLRKWHGLPRVVTDDGGASSLDGGRATPARARDTRPPGSPVPPTPRTRPKHC